MDERRGELLLGVCYHSSSLLGHVLNEKDMPSLNRTSITQVLNGEMESKHKHSSGEFRPLRELIPSFSSPKCFARLNSLTARAASSRVHI